MFKTWGIFGILSNIYDGEFFEEPCVTLAYLERCYMQKLRNNKNSASIYMMSAFLMKPDIIRTLMYSDSNIYDEVFFSKLLSIAYLNSWYIQNLSIIRTRDIRYWESIKCSLHRTMCNLPIFTTLVYLSTNILRAQGILRNLSHMYNMSNIYDGKCYSQICVTLAYLELWQYSESNTYSEYCQTSMTKYFIQKLV